ncbi:hypothetical protein FHT44_004952 [Mycolicibacterium sp. BK634]|nr:hypothetical protein [Mycolicibacterium sp. BK634]MBB3752440.1 hypothetical protein [Mycolicibacterium sp. BK634]
MTYNFWIIADRIHEGGFIEGGERNFQLTMSRERALQLYLELRQEFGR